MTHDIPLQEAEVSVRIQLTDARVRYLGLLSQAIDFLRHAEEQKREILIAENNLAKLMVQMGKARE